MDVLSMLLTASAPYLSQFDETNIAPPLNEWPALVKGQATGQPAHAPVRLPDDLRARARGELQALIVKTRRAAEDALSTLGCHSPLGHAADRATNNAPSGTGSKRPIIITGHQPVLYHPGILLKTLLARDLALAMGGTACNIGIDTDEGDCGALAFPQSTTGGLRRESTTLSRAPGLFFTQRLTGADELQALLRKLTDVLSHTGRSAGGVNRALELYRHATETSSGNGIELSVLNCLIRSQLTATGSVPEIPLSQLSRLPTVLEFFRHCILLSDELVPLYNETLSTYRTERKIKNPANPFPSLAVLEGLTELPFWIVDPQSASREVAHLAPRESGIVHGSSGSCYYLDDLLAHDRSGPFLAPRGMLITATFRVLFADLFIHGMGGGKYDRCTDTFIRNAFGLPPTPFVVASGTVRLFRDEVARFDELKELFESLRSWRANIPLLMDKLSFDEDQIAALKTLQDEKEELLRQLQTKKKAGESAKEEGAALKEIELKVDEIVNERLDVERREYQLVDEESIAVLRDREYPYFFFPELLVGQ